MNIIAVVTPTYVYYSGTVLIYEVVWFCGSVYFGYDELRVNLGAAVWSDAVTICVRI